MFFFLFILVFDRFGLLSKVIWWSELFLLYFTYNLFLLWFSKFFFCLFFFFFFCFVLSILVCSILYRATFLTGRSLQEVGPFYMVGWSLTWSMIRHYIIVFGVHLFKLWHLYFSINLFNAIICLFLVSILLIMVFIFGLALEGLSLSKIRLVVSRLGTWLKLAVVIDLAR